MTKNDISTYGKHFIIEPSSYVLSASEKKLIETLQPVGVMFRSRNFIQDESYELWFAEYSNLLAQLRSLIRHDTLIVCIDHEGGRVVRPPLPITRFPYAAKYACKAEAVAKAMALELKSLGINLNFAPVADIHSNPSNPVINQRAFGCTADMVIKSILPFFKTMEANGVCACAKHFPGHGDTQSDSHFDLPVVEKTIDELRALEFKPFESLIGADVALIMTAHVMYPVLDAKRPATFSTKILNDLLRNEMGFSGAIVADALGMEAVSKIMNDASAAVEGLKAGLDLFCVVGDNVSIEDAYNMALEMQKAKLAPELLGASHARIDKLLARLKKHQPQLLDAAVFTEHAALAKELEQNKDWPNFDFSAPGFE